MTLPYLARLVCLALASFYLLHAALALAASALAPRQAGRNVRRQPARAAARLLTLRLLPGALAAGIVATVCLPAYVRWEPPAGGERAGYLFLAAALLGLAILSLAAGRALGASLEALSLARACRVAGRAAGLAGGRVPLLIVETEEKVLALAGLLRPRLIVSSAALRALSPAQWEAAVAHELAHWSARDNWKRWLWLAAPDLFPGCRAGAGLERRWRRLREWAADDVAAGGDPRRALALAEALLRMGGAAPAPALTSALAADSRDLADRVHRLLEVPPAVEEPPRRPFAARAALAVAAAAATLTLAVACLPAAPHLAYRLLELFVR